MPYRGNASVGRKKENQVPGECERGGRVYHPTQFSEGIKSLSLKGFAKERVRNEDGKLVRYGTKKNRDGRW